MFRASPWIPYDPHQQQLPLHHSDHTSDHDPAGPDTDPDTIQKTEPNTNMDAPEISTLREEEEETPPPDLDFSRFRVNLRAPARTQSSTSSGSVVAPPIGTPIPHQRASSPPDSDDEDEEDQLIDDDELAIVTETGHASVASDPGAGLAVVGGSPASTPSPRKRGVSTKIRPRRGGVTGRRGRPGREPPDAAAMMSTFELAKTDQAGPSSSANAPSPVPIPVAPPPAQAAGPSTSDWSSSAPPKPPRKKPGPKKGSALASRASRKPTAKNAQLASGRGTPVHDDSLPPDSSTFLVPAPPSIPPTPGSDQPPLPPQLPPIAAPDFVLNPSIPVPVYPLPSRTFPVQAPPKTPAGYAATHPLDPRGPPPRKWNLAQREIKGIAGGRWFARTWVGERDKGPAVVRHAVVPSPPPGPAQGPTQTDSGPSRMSDAVRDVDVVQLPRSRQDTSPEPEPEPDSTPRSPSGTNGTPAPHQRRPRPS